MTTRYCEHLSGREAAAVELKERADRWQLADGTIMRFRSGQAYRPVPLDLDPERNRVRLRLSFEMQMPAAEPSSRSYEYQASLFDLDQPLVQRTLSVPTKPNGMQSIVVATVAVHTPAEHLFILEEIGRPPLPPTRVVLRVREGVEQPFMLLVWVGAAMLLGGIGFALVRARRSTRPLARSDALDRPRLP